MSPASFVYALRIKGLQNDPPHKLLRRGLRGGGKVKPRSRTIRYAGISLRIRPYSDMSKGGLAEIYDDEEVLLLLYPDDAEKLARWLMQYVNWHAKVVRGDDP